MEGSTQKTLMLTQRELELLDEIIESSTIYQESGRADELREKLKEVMLAE